MRLPSRIRAAWIIACSKQFDAVYYRDHYEDSEAWGQRFPLLHYVLLGADRGNNPSSLFDPDFSGMPLERSERGGNVDAFLAAILRGTDFPLYLSPAAALRKHILLGARACRLKWNQADYRALVEESAIFDPDYYANTYADSPGEAAACLDHYVRIGIPEGRYPNDWFDPIGYQLKYRDAAFSTLPAVIHYLLLGRAEGRTAPHGLDGVLPNYLPDSHHKIQTNFRRKGKRKTADRQRIVVAIDKSKRQDVTWSYGISEDGSHIVRVRPASWYFDRIARNEPLTFVKRTHGTWDITATWLDNRERLGNLPISNAQSVHLANRLGYYRADAMRKEAVKYIYVENFQQELVADMAFQTNDQNYCHAVSLAGLPVSPRDLFFKFYSPAYVSKLRRVITRLVPPGEYHDATMWKRTIGTGEILQLNNHLRQRPVYFVGLKHYEVLGQRLGWKDFTHIEIPPSGTMMHRVKVFERIRGLIEDRFGRDLTSAGPGRPVIMICAGNLAQWLAHRLHRHLPGGVYLDVGMIYSLWIVDIYPTVHRWIKDLPPELYEPMRILEVLRRAPEDIKDRYRSWIRHEI